MHELQLMMRVLCCCYSFLQVGQKIMSVPKKFLKRKKRVRSLVTVKADKLTIKIIQGCHLGHNFARHNFPLTFIYLYEVNFLHKENFLYNMKNETFKPFQWQVITCLVKLYINCKVWARATTSSLSRCWRWLQRHRWAAKFELNTKFKREIFYKYKLI